MSENIIVIGAGGFGRETLDVIEAINRVSPEWSVLGVVDDAPSELNLQRLAERGYAHLGALDDAAPLFSDARVVTAVGSPVVRARLVTKVDALGAQTATLIHPTAELGSRVTIGPGAVICSGVQVSTNVELGAYAHLNPGAIIGHDVRFDDFVSVNPGATVSGEVTVGTRVLIGAGSVILQGLTIGEGVTVGAAACVVSDVASGHTVVGVPARPTI